MFLLYTELAARKAADGSGGFRGLGHIDSHEDVLTITLNFGVPVNASGKPGDAATQDQPGKGAHKKRARSKRSDVEQTLEVEILQDKTALRSRKGDTGSVVWHARWAP